MIDAFLNWLTDLALRVAAPIFSQLLKAFTELPSAETSWADA